MLKKNKVYENQMLIKGFKCPLCISCCAIFFAINVVNETMICTLKNSLLSFFSIYFKLITNSKIALAIYFVNNNNNNKSPKTSLVKHYIHDLYVAC